MGNIQSSEMGNANAAPTPNLPPPEGLNKTITQTSPAAQGVFPYVGAIDRLSNYEYFNNLFLGQHFEAFNIKVNSKDYSMNYGKLRYVAVNFAGLLSKVIADMLFSEPISVKADEDGDQDWIDIFCDENRLNEQLYESALSNSALGDDLFKLRVGKRHPNDDYSTIILESVTPTIFFPKVDGFNVRALPDSIELSWTFIVDKITYLRKEIHQPGTIENHVFEMQGNRIMQEVDLSILGIEGLSGIGSLQDTGIERYLLIHIPNWKTGNRFFGISDYYDLDKLFYAINNRITKIDNILDKHADPILMVPDGVLDQNGKVNRTQLNMIEVPEGAGAKQKPEYIVWDANMEAGFSEIDKLISMFMMTAEITPDILGMGEGLNDSGRALKFKLMRTIAKAQRKKLYYDRAIKEILLVAQMLADKWNVGIGPENLKLTGKPLAVDLKWQDGLPIDDYEEVTNEIAKVDAGLQSKKDAIMNLDDLDEGAAEEKLEDIKEETAIDLPSGIVTANAFDANGNPIKPANPDNPPEVKPLQKPVVDNTKPPVKKKVAK